MTVDEVRQCIELAASPRRSLRRRTMKLIALAKDILEAEPRGVLPRLSRQTEVAHVTGDRTLLVSGRRVEHLHEMRRITQPTEIRDSSNHARWSSKVCNVLAVGRVACVGEIAWDVEIVVIEGRIHGIPQVLMHDDIRRAENREIVGIVGVPYVIDGFLCFLSAVGIDYRLCAETPHRGCIIERDQLRGDPMCRVGLDEAADRFLYL